MKLEWLEYFTKITPGKSLRQISNDIYLSQQTLSSIITHLENEFGCELLIRSRKGNVKFTSNGELLKNYTLDYLEKIKSIKQKPEVVSELHVAVLASFARSDYSEKILSYPKYNPNINVILHYTANVQELCKYVSSKKCAVALLTDLIINGKSNNDFLNLASQYNLSYIPKANDFFYIVLHKDLIKSKKITFASLNDLNCFCLIYKGADSISTSNILTQFNCTSQMRFEYIYEINLQQLINKNGYGFESHKHNVAAFREKDLIYLPVADDISIDYSILLDNDNFSQHAKNFIDYLF